VRRCAFVAARGITPEIIPTNMIAAHVNTILDHKNWEDVTMRINPNLDTARVALLATGLFAGTISAAAAGSLGGPLELQDEGVFFVNGQVATTNNPDTPASGAATPGEITIDQMYVQYRIPKTVAGPPIIMVHGSGHTGVTYETTPDGREGWATYFARHNFPVYVVDHVGRGRSGFDPTAINRAKAESNPGLLPSVPLTTRERAYPNFLIGAKYPTPYPGQQFPVEAQDQYFAQLVPNTETLLAGGGSNTVKALTALVDKIGPAVVMVHSQSGGYGLELIRQRADKVRAFIDIEGSCGPLSPDDVAKSFQKVPTLMVFGDYTEGSSGPNGDERRNVCSQSVNAINAAGGSARFLYLPGLGIKGNSHMLMMDKNNLQIADLIIGWLGPATEMAAKK
jgi:pimeloyl-ACP methyl ester carboxylesterase